MTEKNDFIKVNKTDFDLMIHYLKEFKKLSKVIAGGTGFSFHPDEFMNVFEKISELLGRIGE